MKIPSYIKKYFWEIDCSQLVFKKDKIYLLKRLLEYGNPKAIHWAWRTLSKKDWLRALRSREISLLTKNFWLSLLK